MGMLGGAVFDAVNSVNRSYSAYNGYFNPTTSGSSIDTSAAAATAANSVLQSVFNDYFGLGNSYSSNFTNKYNTQMSAIADGEGKTRGMEVGLAAAQAMITARTNDGWNATSTYTPQPLGTVGAWQPGSTAGGWGNTSSKVFLKSEAGYMTPFTMSSGSQFRPATLAGFASNQMGAFVQSQTYTDSFNQVQSLGAVNSATRTADQTQIARFWMDGPGTESPPGHWSSIAQTVSAAANLSLEQNARLFGLLGLAEADTAIATWDTKREYDLWRPSLAINTADTDGNASTLQDTGWTPLLPEPSFPSFSSGHSGFSMAGATILANFFGTDNIAFTSDSDFLPGVTRSYNSFSEAAQEAGMSRIYGGIHYGFDNLGGQALGAAVANNALNSMLLPVPEPGSAMLILCTGLAFMLRRRPRFAS